MAKHTIQLFAAQKKGSKHAHTPLCLFIYALLLLLGRHLFKNQSIDILIHTHTHKMIGPIYKCVFESQRGKSRFWETLKKRGLKKSSQLLKKKSSDASWDHGTSHTPGIASLASR